MRLQVQAFELETKVATDHHDADRVILRLKERYKSRKIFFRVINLEDGSIYNEDDTMIRS